MEINLALDAPLKVCSKWEYPVPKLRSERDTVEFEYEWKLNCLARVVVQLDAPEETSSVYVKAVEDIKGKMGLYMNVAIVRDQDSCALCSMFVQDHDSVLRNIFRILGKESSDLSVELKYFDQVISFHDFKFELDADHSKGSVTCDMADIRIQRLTSFQTLFLLSDKIKFDSFTATVTLNFSE